MQTISRVPEPWTPVADRSSNDDIQLEIWNRFYRFNKSALPTSILTAGTELLAAPIQLAGFFADKQIQWTERGTRLLELAPKSATAIGWLNAREIFVSLSSRLEYDGMMRFDLAVAPHRNKAPHLDRLWLDIPIRREMAALFTFWPAAKGTGAVQQNSAVNSGAIPDEDFALPFKPFIWLGTEDAGLSWFAETDENWRPADHERCLEIIRDHGQVLLRLHLMDSPPPQWQGRTDSWGKAIAPLNFTFGIQATPVKPWLKDWHSRHFVQVDYDEHPASYAIEKESVSPGAAETILDRLASHNVNIVVLHEKWTAIQNYWITDKADSIRRTVRACHKRGMKVIPYMGYEMSMLAPEWAGMGDRMVVKDSEGNYLGGWERIPAQRAYVVCYKSEWADKFASGVARLMDDYGFDGVYFDGTTMPWGCANAAHGCGYQQPDGQKRPTYPVFAVRGMLQKIYETIAPRGGIITAHQSSCCLTPTLAFVHSYWDGEHLSKEAKDNFPLASFRAEFMGRNFGIPCEFLGHEQSLCYTIIHDVLLRPGFGNLLDHVGPVWKVFDSFRVDQAEWLPYWKNAGLIKADPDCVKVSCYRRQHRILLVIANVASCITEAKIIFGPQLANLQAVDMTARDAFNREQITIRNKQIVLPLQPASFRLIELIGISKLVGRGVPAEPSGEERLTRLVLRSEGLLRRVARVRPTGRKRK